MFEGSVAGGKADAGETVRVEDSTGRFLAWAAYSPLSSIRLRAWSFDEGERIDAAFFERRIAAAVEARARCRSRATASASSTARPTGCPASSSIATARRCRRSSSPPASSAGRRRSPTRCCARPARARLYERSDTSAREREGLAAGRPAGCAPSDAASRATEVEIEEHGWRFAVDVADRPQDRLLSRPARQPQAVRRHGAPLRASSASSTAIATRAASASPRSPAAQRT